MRESSRILGFLCDPPAGRRILPVMNLEPSRLVVTKETPRIQECWEVGQDS